MKHASVQPWPVPTAQPRWQSYAKALLPVVLGLSLAIACGLFAGALLARSPFLAAGSVLALSLTAAGLLYPRLATAAFLRWLAFVLIGYVCFSRGFAYLGVPPLYVGEIALGLGVIALLGVGLPRQVLASPLLWAVALFGTWGAAQTLPHLGSYRLDALRDAVIWGYAVFTVIVAAVLVRRRAVAQAVRAYGRWAPWLVLWAPMPWVLGRVLGDAMPAAPFTTVPLFYFKPGDAAVHLAGAGTFLILAQGGGWSGRWRPVLAATWIVGAVLVGAFSRGGLLAMLLALGVLFLARPVRTSFDFVRIGTAALFPLAVIGTVAAGALGVLDRVAPSEHDRRVSPVQVVHNLASVFDPDESASHLEGTREWRLTWWSTIADYTLFGEHFWTGKGFGVNLADDDGFQVESDASLRSPHSIHLTVLARAGVPGLLLWTVVLVAFVVTMARGYGRARRRGDRETAFTCLWVLAYWTALLVNASFDVYLEGPQGGIWFWCLMGLGLAAAVSTTGPASRRGAAPPGRTRRTEVLT